MHSVWESPVNLLSGRKGAGLSTLGFCPLSAVASQTVALSVAEPVGKKSMREGGMRWLIACVCSHKALNQLEMAPRNIVALTCVFLACQSTLATIID